MTPSIVIGGRSGGRTSIVRRLWEAWTAIGGRLTMEAMTATAQMTATEFLALEPHDRAARRELVDGELVVSDPTWTHNRAQRCILGALWNWARAAPDRGAAGVPLDVLLD